MNMIREAFPITESKFALVVGKLTTQSTELIITSIEPESTELGVGLLELKNLP